MPMTNAVVNGSTAIIGAIMLVMMAYGSWRYGFFRQFDMQLGRRVMLLGLVDLLGLALWH